jgi:hypothetical protein
MLQAIFTHHGDSGKDGNVKHIDNLVITANLLTNQNGLGNGIAPEDTASLGFGVLDKLDPDFEEHEISIENTKEGLEAVQSTLKKVKKNIHALKRRNKNLKDTIL